MLGALIAGVCWFLLGRSGEVEVGAPAQDLVEQPAWRPEAVPIPDEPEPGAGFVAEYPAQPREGTVLWGSSVHGNGDPYVRHEQYVGVPAAVRRTFFRWDQRTGAMTRIAEEDVSAGRLPWVSVKTPSWAAMAAGEHDGDIDQMLRAVGEVDGPVWLTVHHEPEGGGGTNQPDDAAGAAGHLEMNRRVRERMDVLGIDNVALAPVFMAWTWDPRSGREIDDWWDEGVYDFLGVDIYRDSESSLVTSNWYRVRAWAEERGVDVAVGEWGMRGDDAAAGERVHEWFEHAVGSHADARGARVVALSAFDSNLGARPWQLEGEQLDAYRELLLDPRVTRITD